MEEETETVGMMEVQAQEATGMETEETVYG